MAFERIDGEPSALEIYSSVVSDALLDEVRSLAARLKGLRVAHINATANGGGVAEILRSLIPLYQGLGIDASWLVMEGDADFFDVTKRLHNALQGAPNGFTPADWGTYMACNRRNAACLEPVYDVVFVHDPQPAAIRQFAQDASRRWVWRCHIDTSTPNATAWEKLSALVNGYDASVFSVADFVGSGVRTSATSIIPPAIDPLSPKNRHMPTGEAVRVVGDYGVDTERAFVTQVSRFDPWKDPVGVIEAFKALRTMHPGLQLVLLGNFADDDPEGTVMYQQVLDAASEIDDVHVIMGLTDLVGPFQSLSQVVLQKSLREGFGLTVTEALWKGTPVVGGNAGGIRLQVMDGIGGYTVDSVEECVARVDHLLTHEQERIALGLAGREHVRSHFLLPRLLRDELALTLNLVGG